MKPKFAASNLAKKPTRARLGTEHMIERHHTAIPLYFYAHHHISNRYAFAQAALELGWSLKRTQNPDTGHVFSRAGVFGVAPNTGTRRTNLSFFSPSRYQDRMSLSSSSPPSLYTIYNDRDAMNLDHLLIAGPAHRALKAREIIIHLEGTTAFTERGAVKLAECLCKLDERPIVRVQVAPSMLDFEFVNNVVSIVYLQGNKPELYVRDPNRGRRVSEEFDNRCRQLQRNYKYLREFEFRQYFGKAASIQFAMSLHGNTALKKLTLRFDNDLSTDQGLSLAAAICNSAVTSLTISNMCMSSTEFGGEGLKVLLQEGIQASGRLLETLEIDAMNRKLNTNGLAEIIPCVESLSLRCMHFGLSEDRSHFRSLCEGLGRTSNLLGLTLERCNLDDDATRMLFNALQNHRSMTSLNVIDCHIGDAGVASLVENWPEDSKLEQLDLRANHVITTRGVQRLMTALPNRRALKALNIMGNCFHFDVVEMIGIHLPNLKISEIYIGEVFIDDEMRRIRVMDRWLQGIKANHFLQTIFMVRNRSIRLELMDEIDFYTKLNKYGRYLLPIANDVPPTLWCLIFAKARTEREFNLSMIFYFLVQLPHLVNERKRRKRRTDQPPITGRNARLRCKKG